MRRRGFEGMEEARRNAGDVINGGVESAFVGFGGMVHAGDFADELEGSGADFVGGDGGIEIEKWFDVAANVTVSSFCGQYKRRWRENREERT